MQAAGPALKTPLRSHKAAFLPIKTFPGEISPQDRFIV